MKEGYKLSDKQFWDMHSAIARLSGALIATAERCRSEGKDAVAEYFEGLIADAKKIGEECSAKKVESFCDDY
jgi:hypothetical protein